MTECFNDTLWQIDPIHAIDSFALGIQSQRVQHDISSMLSFIMIEWILRVMFLGWRKVEEMEFLLCLGLKHFENIYKLTFISWILENNIKILMNCKFIRYFWYDIKKN